MRYLACRTKVSALQYYDIPSPRGERDKSHYRLLFNVLPTNNLFKQNIYSSLDYIIFIK